MREEGVAVGGRILGTSQVAKLAVIHRPLTCDANVLHFASRLCLLQGRERLLADNVEAGRELGIVDLDAVDVVDAEALEALVDAGQNPLGAEIEHFQRVGFVAVEGRGGA